MPTEETESPHRPQYYSYREEVLVGRVNDDPGRRLPRTGLPPSSVVAVRFESAATLTFDSPPGASSRSTAAACDALDDDDDLSSDSASHSSLNEPHRRRTTTTTRTSPRLPASPFPPKLSRLLLESFPDLTRFSVQVNHRASDSYPASPLDAVPLLLHHTRWDDPPANRTHSTPWKGLGGPSGVSLHAEFVVPTLVEEHTETRSEDVARRMHRRILEDQLEALAQDLHDLRILLAPASLARSRTTLRKQPRPVLWGSDRSNPSETSTSANDNNNTTIAALSLVWPIEASMFSTEGMEAFLRWLPCHEGSAMVTSGIWSLASPHDWSHLLLGTDGSATLPQHLPNRRLWMEATVSDDCRGGGGKAESALCRLTWTQGVEFAVATKFTPSTNLASVRQLLTFAAAPATMSNDDDHLATCPFADTTRLTRVVVRRQSGPRGTKDGAAKIPEPALALHSTSLPSQTSLTEPLLHLEDLHPTNDSLDPDAATFPRWQVAWRLLHRHNSHHHRSGLSQHRDALRAALRNRDPHCPARVEFRHALPLVLEPDWTSVGVVLRRLRASDDDTQTSNSTNSVVHLAWSDLDEGRIDVVQDPSFGPILEWSFRYELPPASELELRLEYHPAFLSFETFPADPNRGFEVPPFSATFAAPAECVSSSYPPEAGTATLYSSSVLLLTPVPDLSMPFNVLSLTCTLYALIIGAIFNLALRRASERVKYTLNPELEPPSWKNRLPSWKNRLKERLVMLRQALRNRFRLTSSPTSDAASESSGVQEVQEDPAAAAETPITPEEAHDTHPTKS